MGNEWGGFTATPPEGSNPRFDITLSVLMLRDSSILEDIVLVYIMYVFFSSITNSMAGFHYQKITKQHHHPVHVKGTHVFNIPGAV